MKSTIVNALESIEKQLSNMTADFNTEDLRDLRGHIDILKKPDDGEFTKDQFRILLNLVQEVTDQSDFEYQEEEYQNKMTDLVIKLQSKYLGA